MPFSKTNCQQYERPTCLATSDRGLFNDSDAILFHGRALNSKDLPPPSWRRPHQHYIFYLHESPAHTDLSVLRDNHFKNYFNRTMTYRRDSDIVDLYPYGRIKCNHMSTPKSKSLCLDFPLSSNSSTQDIFESTALTTKIDLTGKNRTVAWFSTNCWTDSKRESLVRNLSLHIPVDIYGRCSNNNLSCPQGKQEDECNLMLSRHYRFYLSFENSLCPDYVTEKLYRPLLWNTVPIVFGGSDYSLYLPSGSYIDAMNFTSPLELANYLKKLMVEDDLYLSYFHWKRQYVVERRPFEGICQLCRMISKPIPEEKVYSDIEAWWTGRLNNKTCFSPPASLVS